MDTWRQISECLDSGLIGALKIEGCSARVGTGNADAAQISNIVEAKKAAGAEAPAQGVRRQGGTRRGGLTVFLGGRLALHVAAPAAPIRATGIRLVTVNGVRVGQSNLANSP